MCRYCEDEADLPVPEWLRAISRPVTQKSMRESMDKWTQIWKRALEKEA